MGAHATVEGMIVSGLVIGVTVGIPVCTMAYSALSRRRAVSTEPGAVLFSEVLKPLEDDRLSLAAKREALAEFEGQRVRWSVTFQSVSPRGAGWTAQLLGDAPAGIIGCLFHVDVDRADGKRLERLVKGARVVIEGTVVVNWDFCRIGLAFPKLRDDLTPNQRSRHAHHDDARSPRA